MYVKCMVHFKSGAWCSLCEVHGAFYVRCMVQCQVEGCSVKCMVQCQVHGAVYVRRLVQFMSSEWYSLCQMHGAVYVRCMVQLMSGAW